MDFVYDGGGIGKGGTAAISVDGREVAKGRIEKTVPVRISQEEGLDVGEDTGTPSITIAPPGTFVPALMLTAGNYVGAASPSGAPLFQLVTSLAVPDGLPLVPVVRADGTRSAGRPPRNRPSLIER